MLTPHFQLKSNLPEQTAKIIRSVGRPTVMTPTVLQKLETAFTNGAPDREACDYAGISYQSLYNYQNENPEYIEQKEAFKRRPNLTSRKAIVENLRDPKWAAWWLERKDPDLRPTSKLDVHATVKAERTPASADVIEAVKAYEEIRLKQIQQEARKTLTPKSDESSTAPAAGEIGS